MGVEDRPSVRRGSTSPLSSHLIVIIQVPCGGNKFRVLLGRGDGAYLVHSLPSCFSRQGLVHMLSQSTSHDRVGSTTVLHVCVGLSSSMQSVPRTYIGRPHSCVATRKLGRSSFFIFEQMLCVLPGFSSREHIFQTWTYSCVLPSISTVCNVLRFYG